MTTANEILFDASIAHQVGVRRFTAGEVRRLLELLEAADRELVRELRRRLEETGSDLSTGDARLQALLLSIREFRRETLSTFRTQLRSSLFDLAAAEADFELRMLREAIPIEFRFADVDARQLRSIVTSRPFQGRLLREWFSGLEQVDRARLTQAVRLGMAQGESIQQIVRRVAGTRAANFTDGALSTTRRNAESVVRTAVNHVSNRAREEVWKANATSVQALRWTATLDGRTSAVCRGRDGKFATVPGGQPLPPDLDKLVPAGARPPAHINCRSVMVAVFDGIGILGDRPSVVDTRNRRRREIDFRAEAKRRGVPIRQVRKEWADQNIGQVPAETSYNQWLRRQPAGFQDEVLGKTKGALFRRGDLDVDRFIDRRGNELTLQELRAQSPEAFTKANVD